MTEAICQKNCLADTISEVCQEYGFERIAAEFVSFKDFKVRWTRQYKEIAFEISDYLEDAPPEVVTGLIENIMQKIVGKDSEGYSSAAVAWLTSPEFSEKMQPIYLKRSRSLSRSPAGKTKDLCESFDRLAALGLVPEDLPVYLTWTKNCNECRVGNCSVLMRVVTISSIFDADNIPDFLLDYVLYHELCHLMIGFDPAAKAHGEKFSAMLAKFPEMGAADALLKKLGLGAFE